MNVGAIIAGHAETQPQKVAIDGSHGELTYAALDQNVRNLAARLAQAGIGVGNLVAVRMRDTPEHVAALVAVARIGAVILPIDWRAAPAEIEKSVERMRPSLLLTDDATLPKLTVATMIAAETEATDALVPPAGLNESPLAYAMTSGTTGEPKAFVLTHEAYHARVMQFRDSGLILPADRLLGPIPLAYSAGREMALGLMVQGATFLMLPAMSEPAEIVNAANRRRASVLLVSPNVTRALLTFAGEGGRRLMPDLRLYINATAKADPDERARAKERLAPAVADMYGTTGAGLISVLQGEADSGAASSVGRQGPGIEVGIADDDNVPVPTGEIGRIRVRGPGVVRRFVGDAAPGDEGIHGDWYFPGDIGSFDAAGFLHVHDRAADLIKRGGLMIHAQEVERVLRSHPMVADAAVAGVPAPSLGQEVAAIVVVRGDVDARRLTAFCREHLAGYKVPAHFRFVGALPRNANGKVAKAEMLKDWK